jgi:hypothetical protein
MRRQLRLPAAERSILDMDDHLDANNNCYRTSIKDLHLLAASDADGS